MARNLSRALNNAIRRAMQKLTQAELEIMQVLWKLRKGYIRDILKASQHDKRAYTTVSTIMRILQTKGFVGSNSFGRANEYFPLINKDEYTSFYVNDFIDQYFDGSFRDLISFCYSRNEDD